LVELCELQLPTYYIEDETKLISNDSISHFNFHNKEILTSQDYLPKVEKPKILITSGASCPDAVVERVIEKILSFYPHSTSLERAIELFQS
jgi:4-hydroxy-3-methylbut-2-enyl diphosphate reductase